MLPISVLKDVFPIDPYPEGPSPFAEAIFPPLRLKFSSPPSTPPPSFPPPRLSPGAKITTNSSSPPPLFCNQLPFLMVLFPFLLQNISYFFFFRPRPLLLFIWPLSLPGRSRAWSAPIVVIPLSFFESRQGYCGFLLRSFVCNSFFPTSAWGNLGKNSYRCLSRKLGSGG